jgi:hypothetical protein
MSDYLKDQDLNPTINGGAARVDQPFDPRAMHYFGFTANGQELRNMSPFRMFVSWSYVNQPTPFTGGPFPQVDAVLEPMGSGGDVIRYDLDHDRSHVVLWLDPAAIPPVGIAVNSRVRAWSK